ncbi:MAG: exodeoxyribonuclease III [Myxococcaceae bacterium]|nr:exodeoxyribonuclease III [Myxococcaceae bacterium]
MKISTWNVNGLRAREGDVHHFLREEAPDLLCLQEVKASLHQVPVSLRDHEGYWSYWHGHKGYSGVAMLVRRSCCPVRPVFTHPSFDVEQRIVVAELGALRVASIYVPNGGKEFAPKLTFLRALASWAGDELRAGHDLVLCGDLNVARTAHDVHESERDATATGQTEAERSLFEQLLAHQLTDLGRRFAPDDASSFTWWAPWREHRERNIGWRIDYVLTSSAMSALAKACTARREFGTSDHAPVSAVFERALFDPATVKAGPAQELVQHERKGPQLDLFGS